jgi:transposase
MMAGLKGIVVHDHWKPYYALAEVQHALCNAHHLRELKALVEIEKEAWARHMQTLLRRACHAVTLAKQQKTVLRARMVALITRRYDAIVASSTAWHEALPPLAGKTNRDGSLSRKQPRRVGHNLLIRLSHRTKDVLRFLTNPQVPFTNNQAERDLRMMKLRQKISGGFRSYQGALDFAALRTTIGTAKKQGWNVIESLMQTPDALLQKLRAA